MRRLRAFTVAFNDGTRSRTHMNPTITNQEIQRYYLGQNFTEEVRGREITRTGTHVEIHQDDLSCQYCFTALEQHHTTHCPKCRKPLTE